MLRKILSSAPISADLGLLILRLATAAILIKTLWQVVSGFHGIPGDMARFGDDTVHFLTAIFMFVGAILLGIGLLTRVGTVLLMLGSALAIERGVSEFSNNANGNILLFAVAVGFFLTGPGAFSLEGAMGGGGSSRTAGKSREK